MLSESPIFPFVDSKDCKISSDVERINTSVDEKIMPNLKRGICEQQSLRKHKETQGFFSDSALASHVLIESCH
jgi:hypothetical protein